MLADEGRLFIGAFQPRDLPLAAQPAPAFGAQRLQAGDVVLEDAVGVLVPGGHGAVDAGLAQQVQRGPGRLVGGILDVVDGCARKRLLFCII